MFLSRLLLALTIGALGCACTSNPAPSGSDEPTSPTVETEPFLDTVQARTFDFFWETTNARNGLAPDRWPDPPFSSVAAGGFALTAYVIGVERGYVTRSQARQRTLTTLEFLWNAPQGPGASNVTGRWGFFYHFLDMESGRRHGNSELSTIDTALFLMGALTAQQFFDGADSTEIRIRALADSLYRRAEWDRMQLDSGLLSMGWTPTDGRFPHGYEGYDEALFLYILALGSPTHPVDDDAWRAYTDSYDWDSFYGYEHVNFAPLFGHQYAQVWLDLRDVQDAYMREKGIDYFENSRRATLAQRSYAKDNPDDFAGYRENVWGLTASDGPGNTTVTVNNQERTFKGYWARGAASNDIRDDGTIAPTAVGGSVPFAPDATIGALKTMRTRYGEFLFGTYGFYDAFNPTYTLQDPPPDGGQTTPKGWFDDEYLGIDQGPILAMIENHRSGLLWSLMRENPHVVRGLCRAGFSGGWLDERCE